MAIRRPFGERICGCIGSEAKGSAGSDQLDIDIEVILFLSIPRKCQLLAVGREAGIILRPEIAREWDGTEIGDSFRTALGFTPSQEAERHDNYRRNRYEPTHWRARTK